MHTGRCSRVSENAKSASLFPRMSEIAYSPANPFQREVGRVSENAKTRKARLTSENVRNCIQPSKPISAPRAGGPSYELVLV
jgi:hypothetical protein